MCGHILYKVRHTMERCGQIAALFIPPWMSIILEDLDLTDPEHWKYLSWGRLIMPFECAMSLSETHSGLGPMQSYAFIQEYWPYDHAADDILCR